MAVLTVNAGSSSLKVRLLAEGGELVADLETSGDELADTIDGLPRIDAVGHRIVHGGEEFEGPVAIEGDVRERLESLASLAPLHQRPALDGIDAVGGALPGVPQVACFDTTFHRSMPEAARTAAVPTAWREAGLRRYGFHGLSHAYVARRAPELLKRDAATVRIVSCHLGSGASLCAIAGGRSVETTMGFTPLEGLVMATRSGSLDPAAVLWLIEERGLAAADVRDALEHESGLAALAGTDDMESVLARDDDAAALALDVFVHHVVLGAGAMAAALGGADVIAFTGGVGERSKPIRELVMRRLGFLDASTVVIEAREDLEIARGVRAALR